MLIQNKTSFAVLTAFVFSSQLFANDRPEASLEPEASVSDQDMEIIEVYAQKRLQKITDVSVAVTALNSDSITRLQLKDTTQLASLVPSMKTTNNAGEGTPPALNIRGVGMIDYNTSTVSPIAIYNDGVVSGSANNLSVNLFDLEHVEVLRGPQGTLFGRNTTGGAILLRSKKPEETFGGYVNASVAQHDHQQLTTALNMPLTDNTGARLAVNHHDYQFSTNNLMPNQPDGGLKQTSARLMVVSTFDDLTATIKFEHADWRGKPKPIASNGILKTDGSGLCSPSQAGSSMCQDQLGNQVGGNDFWDVNADTADRTHDSEIWGASITLDWQLSNQVLISSITAIRELDRFHSWDSDGPANFIEGTMGTDNKLLSQEFNLAYENQNLFWQTGLFFLNEKIDQDSSFDLARDLRAIPAAAANALNFFYDNELENESWAIYSQFDYQLNDSFLFTAGLRFTEEETRYHANADLDTAFGIFQDYWDISGNVDDEELSGKLALIKTLSANNSLYASYTRGYKSGGYNAGYSISEQQAKDSTYAPETLNAYEVGLKLNSPKRELQWHVAAFYYDYQDQQVFVNVPDRQVPYHLLKNAGDSIIYGLDSELVYTPSSNLQFMLNIGYLPKAQTGSFEQGDLVVNQTRLPFSSRWNVSTRAIYETNVWQRQLTVELAADYQSDFYFDQNENPYTEQQAYTVINGRISYQAHPDLLLSIWGKNLTNTEYAELRFDSIAALKAVTELKGESRQLGVEIMYSF
ncbi:TonB-dependent receptor [Thalassotalea marina]|uniref:TonB-dependent receptor n=1 Tax=Thalassotalea marina TaxID=1673741 RepID=A0A919EMZ0_9GAMM|nr:TonB-dependent receptor [Thalassotalea marina]GHG00036.1 TonB-dependent receptor [Thalassotalea marina]